MKSRTYRPRSNTLYLNLDPVTFDALKALAVTRSESMERAAYALIQAGLAAQPAPVAEASATDLGNIDISTFAAFRRDGV